MAREAGASPGWKKKLPFLRWSILRMFLTAKRQLLVHWQAGDGREEKLARYVLARARPKRILELGTYCGYSALRMAAAAPEAQIVSIEFNAANADVARRIFAHAGAGARVTVVVGTLGDGGATLRALRETHRFGAGTVDFVFVDHAKDAYLP